MFGKPKLIKAYINIAIIEDIKNGKITRITNQRGKDAGRGDESGRKGTPAVYHHGTGAKIDAFQVGHEERYDNGWLGRRHRINQQNFSSIYYDILDKHKKALDKAKASGRQMEVQFLGENKSRGQGLRKKIHFRNISVNSTSNPFDRVVKKRL